MDNETRGIIIKLLNDFTKNLKKKSSTLAVMKWFKEEVLVEDIALDWVNKDSNEFLPELVTGYVIGYMISEVHGVVIRTRMNENLDKIPEDKTQDYLKMTDDQKLKFLGANITMNELKEIREMVKPKIPLIRKEVYRALSV